MQPSSKKHHTTAAAPAPASGPTSTPDIVIPPPNGAAPPPPTDTMPMTQVPARPMGAPDLPPMTMSSTQMVTAGVAVLVWAGLLIFIKRLLTQSLVAQFADLGRARAAGTTLYLFLLVLGATLIVCAIGGFWQMLVFTITAGVLNVVLLVLFLFSYSAARASRQRR